MPCSLDDLRRKGYDYWALGHVHGYEVLADDPPIVFAGNLQGRHARETGAKGVVRRGGRRAGRHLLHRPLDVMRWAVRRVDAAGATTEDELMERARTGSWWIGRGGRPTAHGRPGGGPTAHARRTTAWPVAGRASIAGVRAASQDVGGGDSGREGAS